MSHLTESSSEQLSSFQQVVELPGGCFGSLPCQPCQNAVYTFRGRWPSSCRVRINLQQRMLICGILLFFLICNYHKKNNLSQTVWGWILEAQTSRGALGTRTFEFCHHRKQRMKSRSCCFLLKATLFQPVLLCLRHFKNYNCRKQLVPKPPCAGCGENTVQANKKPFCPS